jgi:glutamate/tyrosine decarboxylase-like PLP-dependent enzyme
MDDLSPESLQEFFRKLQADTEDFLHANKPFNYRAYHDNVASISSKHLPIKGRAFHEVIEDIRSNILPGAIHQHHKNFIAFPDKGSHISSQYAAMLSDIMNQNLVADYKSAPTGTYIEMRVISWLRQLVGYKVTPEVPSNALELGGAMVTGGVLSNTIGLLGARHHACPESKTRGMVAFPKTPKIFVAGSTISHYSHYGASWWLGFGTENVVEVACNNNGRMDQSDLEQKITHSLAIGELPVAIIAVMGDSRTNTLEDLPGLYSISQRFNVWLHVDACHGGVLAFDRKAKHNTKHILSYSDSLTMDPHKHLGIPYAGSVILFKDAQHMANIGSNTDITITYESSDIGQITPFLGSRTFDALKLYTLLETLGVEGIYKAIQKKRKIVRDWHSMLARSKFFMPLHEPELFAQAFTLRPGAMRAEQLSKKNTQLHDRLYQDGKVVVNKFGLRDYRNVLPYGKGNKLICLGSAIGVDTYTPQDLKVILTVLEQTAAQVLGTPPSGFATELSALVDPPAPIMRVP